MHIIDCFIDFLGKKLTNNCIDNPIFIVGMGRSGTSVLLQAIGKHPKIIAFPGEAPFLTSIGGNASLFDPTLNQENADYYRSSLKVDLDYLQAELARIGLEAAGGRHFGIRHYAKTAWHSKNFSIKNHWSAKTFPSEKVAKGILNVYPNAKFIYIVRNGIEVVHSMTKFHGFRDKEFKHHCQMWSDSVDKYRYLTRHEQAIFVRHEDLVNSPVDFFSSLFAFLELSEASQCTQFVQETLVHPLDQQTQHQHNAIEQLKQRKSPFHEWSTSQQTIFRSICVKAMNELSYPFE